MPSFSFPFGNTSVPVHLPSDSLTEKELTNFPAFKTWSSTLQHSLSLQHSKKDHVFHSSPYSLRSITIQSIDRFGGDRLGFVKLTAEIKNDADEKLPGSIFLRGGSVGMLVVLQPDDVDPATETDKFVLLTVQPRVPAGSLSLTELPAGMIDDSGSFSGAAAKEIKEELDLDIPADQLVDLTELTLKHSAEDGSESSDEQLQKGVYTSPGGCDEFVPLFLHQRRVKRDTLKEWQGKFTGLRSEGEKITLKVCRLEELWKVGVHDAKALSAWALYEGLRKAGNIPKTDNS